MKKLFTIVAVAMFSLAMVSCASDVDKAKKALDEAVEAVEKGDYAKAEKAMAEAEEIYDTLSKEDKKKFDKYAESKMGDLNDYDDDYDDDDDDYYW